MHIKKILVGLDRETKRAAPVFETALSMAEKEEAELLVFHCLPQETVAEVEDRIGALTELEQSQGLEKRDHLRRSEMDHVRAWLDSHCRSAEERGVSATSAVEVGKAGPALVALADHWQADLIVVGRAQRSVLKDVLLGSVSHHVVHHAPCSILFVHERHFS
jgi:nucleotide-binding universal stress UspA family protein